jgi:signal transduction histidine kinase
VEVVLLRAVQEALANLRKHAGAARVSVGLSVVDSAARLVVADNGCGFDPAGPPEDSASKARAGAE